MKVLPTEEATSESCPTITLEPAWEPPFEDETREDVGEVSPSLKLPIGGGQAMDKPDRTSTRNQIVDLFSSPRDIDSCKTAFPTSSKARRCSMVWPWWL
jgi:hypothetical protein